MNSRAVNNHLLEFAAMSSSAPREQQTVLRLSDEDGLRVLSVEGPLTLATLFPFQEAWRSEPAPTLIFDLAAVPYADSAAIGSIVNAYVSRQNSGRKMAVVVQERVRKVMQITKVATLFPIFETLGEAKESFKNVSG